MAALYRLKYYTMFVPLSLW